MTKMPQWACFWLIGLFWIASPPAWAMSDAEAARRLEALTWYSEEYPPYNFDRDGVASGLAVDVLMAAFERIGVGLGPEAIKIIPWNRSYKFIQTRPGTALFSMTDTPERRRIMKFVGPIVPTTVAVIAPKAARHRVESTRDLSTLRIGVVRDDIGDQMMRRLALSDDVLVRKNSLRQLLSLLGRDRIDAVAYSLDVFNHALRGAGTDPGEFAVLRVLKTGEMGYAFHAATDAGALAVLQRAIDGLRADGTLGRIVDRYLK